MLNKPQLNQDKLNKALLKFITDRTTALKVSERANVLKGREPISKDDVLNVKILLQTTKTVNEFLTKLG